MTNQADDIRVSEEHVVYAYEGNEELILELDCRECSFKGKYDLECGQTIVLEEGNTAVNHRFVLPKGEKDNRIDVFRNYLNGL